MRTTLRFDPRGSIQCLHTEVVDLRKLGRLHVVRATGIDFNPEEQRWEVRCAASGQFLFADPSREACLAWEQANLQPGTPVSPTTPSTSIMKPAIIAALVLAACIVPSCGPSEKELRAELQKVNTEIHQLQADAQQYRAQMSQAEFDAFIGSFAAGYGAVTGDYGLAADGTGTAYSAANQASAANYSLDQIKQRFEALSKRRSEILKDLD
jgi:outer membrane murein-binding lipoprotein Lpp